MGGNRSLEETVQRESSNWVVAKGLLIPGYSFKLWNDARKITGRGSDFLDAVQMETGKCFAYIVAGGVIYAAVCEYLNR